MAEPTRDLVVVITHSYDHEMSSVAMLAKDRDAFVEVLGEVSPKPPDMERILRVNRGELESAA